MKKFFALVFLCISFIAVADELELIYCEGTVQQKQGNSWVTLISGDTVDKNAVIRVEQDSLAEFEGTIDNHIINFSIIDEGTYNISNLVASSGGMDDSGFLALLGSKVDYLLSTSNATRESHLGVRGDVIGEGDTVDEIQWESTEKYLIDGILELEKGEIDTALDYFEKSLNNAVQKEKPEIYYYMGLSYYRIGLKTKALKILRDSPPQDTEYFYNDYVMLCGSLYIYSANYNEAIRILSTVKENDLKDSDKQILYYIRGISFLKITKHAEAIENFKKAVDIDPESTTGKNAKDYLDKL